MTRSLRILFALVCLLVAFGVFIWHVPSFVSKPKPAKTYDEALAQFAALEASEAKLPLRTDGRSQLLVHGKKTERVFVLLHGLTNNPNQFMPMGKTLFDAGANVVIPRSKYAGFADLLNDLQGLQSGQDLIDQAATGLDIASGLGTNVTMIGLSGSSVGAAWLAQNRDGIDSLVLLSPFFGVNGFPVPVADFLAALLSRAPNFYVWWNPKLRDANPGPAGAYPRFGSFCMADTLQLARNVREHIHSRPLRVNELSVVFSAADIAINGHLVRQMADEWKAQLPGHVTIVEFPAGEKVPHDMIDPAQPDEKISLTYPRILALPGVKMPGVE